MRPMRLPADDAALAEYLENANLPALVPAIVQLTGDASLLRRFPAPSPGMMGAVEGDLAPEDQAAIRAMALEALKAYRDGDGPLPPLPSAAQLHEMMNWCAGEALPAEYVPLAIEEASLGEPDPRRFVWDRRPDPATLGAFRVVIIGAGLAFLWFNAPPAAVFMGDTGSLALGGTIGVIAVTAHHEIVLGVVGGLFVVEALSVIIQVFFYKRTGKRVFKMAPIHHHFEQLGWAEPTVVIRFWIISFVLALAGLATLKLR